MIFLFEAVTIFCSLFTTFLLDILSYLYLPSRRYHFCLVLYIFLRCDVWIWGCYQLCNLFKYLFDQHPVKLIFVMEILHAAQIVFDHETHQ